jgi:rfaE bifunctional protein nucleotidyltransferase chain/domain
MMEKIYDSNLLLEKLSKLSRPLVFTNGVFDVLHRGHVTYLQDARALGGSLIVALNSDASAKRLGKGPDRPLNKAEDRAAVISALESVSAVTYFDEKTPVELIKKLMPDIYVKGGDYDMSTLEETRIVSEWGGLSIAIPFLEGYSTTALVNRIRHPPTRKAAFLDRDGVINIDRGYVHTWDQFTFVDGAIDAMRRLRDAGYMLVIVTNQSGIARGMYDEHQYKTLTDQMCAQLNAAGATIEAVYHCPHHPEGIIPIFTKDCECRKPKPGLLLKAAADLNLSLKDSFMVGDKPTDIEAARAAGVGQAYLIQPNIAAPSSKSINPDADSVHLNLRDCVGSILRL